MPVDYRNIPPMWIERAREEARKKREKMTIHYDAQFWIEKSKKNRIRGLREEDAKRVCAYYELIRKSCENCRRAMLGKGANAKCLYPYCKRKTLEDQIIRGKEIP